MTRIVSLITLMVFFPILGRAASVTRAQGVMGTILEISVEGPDASQLDEGVQQAFERVRDLENLWTLFSEESELSLINKEASQRPVAISRETFKAVKEARKLWKKSKKFFDPTAVAFHKEKVGLYISTESQNGSFKDIKLLKGGKFLSFKTPHTRLDLDGIAKGIALDEAASILKTAGATEGRLNFGGQIFQFGAEGRNQAAAIQIGDPGDPRKAVLSLILGNGSISTSNQKEGWNRDGGPTDHIQNPLSGEAAKFNGTVSVIAPTGAEADAWSTALFAMGPEKGLPLADKEKICAIYSKNSDDGWGVNAARSCPSIFLNQ